MEKLGAVRFDLGLKKRPFKRDIYISMTLTNEQQNVFNWLNDKLQLPVFAEAYKGALDLLDKKSPGYITFAAHAGRDLMNRLAATVSGVQSDRVQYEQHLDGLQNEWKEEWRAEGFNKIDTGENGHLIPSNTCQKVKDLIDKHKMGRLRSSEADNLFFMTFLAYEDKEKIPRNFLREWKAAKEWFLAYAHLREKEFDKDAPSKVTKHFQMLDGLLYVAASSEFGRIKGIHEILEETNG